MYDTNIAMPNPKARQRCLFTYRLFETMVEWHGVYDTNIAMPNPNPIRYHQPYRFALLPLYLVHNVFQPYTPTLLAVLLWKK